MYNPAVTAFRWLCLLSVVHVAVTQSFSQQRIPFGAIFDPVNAIDAEQSAAFYQAIILNNKPASQNSKVKQLHMLADFQKAATDDSYAVGAAICTLMINGMFAFFTPHTSASINTIKSYSSTFRMPFITPNTAMNTSGQENGFELYVRPLYARPILDIIKHYDWRNIWYIYDSDEGLERLQQLLDVMTDDRYIAKLHVYRVTGPMDAFETIRRLDSRKEEGKKIFLDLPTRDCQELLERQNKETRGMLHHYFIVGLGMGDMMLEVFNHGGLNVTGFRLADPQSIPVKSFLVEWSKLDKKTFPGAGFFNISIDAALAVDAVTVIYRALSSMANTTRFKDAIRTNIKFIESISCDDEPVQTWKHGPDIMKHMRSVDFVGLTGPVKFDSFGLRKDYKLEILEVNLNRAISKIGMWKTEGVEINPGSLIQRPKGNNTIANRTRTVTSIMGAPYLMERKPEDGTVLEGNERYEGYCADLAKMIAEFVGFEYKIEPVKDEKYGRKNETTGEWDGMVGALVRHEADLAIAPLTITADRERVIDFSKPFMSLGISIMIKRPSKEIPGVFSFMAPLSYEIWMCVIFAYIGVSVVLFLVSRFSPFEWHIEDNTDGPSVTNNFTIFNSLWFSLGAFMQQGCDIEPRSMSGRIVGSVWWFFTLIIISSYTANLAAFLTVERMQSPIESAEDLSKQTEIKYGTVASGSTRDFFKASTIPVYERMFAFMTTAEPSVGLFVKSNADGVQKVREGKYAFLIESTTNDYINQQYPCDTMKVGSNLDSKGYGIGTALASDLRDRITLAVLEFSETEQLANLEKKWWYAKGQCPSEGSQSKQEATSSLKLPNVAGIFYILIGGLALALIMATLEFLYKSKIEAQRRKTSFGNAIRSKARLSITGLADRQTTAYTYAPSAQLISLDGYAEANTHTQV